MWCFHVFKPSLVVQMVKRPPAVQETWVWSMGREDPLEKGMTTHSSILPWRIPFFRGAWWVTVHGVTESDTTERLTVIFCCCCCCVASVVSDSVQPHRRQPTRLPVPGILQARTLEWVAISFSNAWKSKVKVKSLSRVWLLVTPWTAAYQAPPSMGFSRQEYWSWVPLPSLHTYISSEF